MRQVLLSTLAISAMLILFAFTATAQVTTSSMNGTVYDNQNAGLVGATVKAVHTPSGTVYYATTQNGGNFSILGMRVGGPYEVEISFVGFTTEILTDIYLLLGDAFSFTTRLEEESLTLGEAVVTATRRSAFGSERSGATTNVNTRQIQQLPTISRTVSDIVKLSPYSSGSGSFGGRPAYATNVTIDGANFNNNFGLNNNSMPGPGSGDPISMDVIDEMQVTVAPYDVRQSNFTGAGINIVTKSGTNDFKGSAYFYFRNEDLNGKKINGVDISSETSKKVYGFTLGGPIIKNKLFFFVSGEIEDNKTPGNTLLARGNGRDPDNPNVSTRVSGEQMQDFSDFLYQKYGYVTGRYENWGGDNDKNNKLLAKIDWNINDNHKATFRYNYSHAESTSRPSSSGDARPTISGSRHSRTGGMSFENSQYRPAGNLHSFTAELNSRITNSLSNNLLVAYTNYKQPRETDSQMFPFIDIMDGVESSGGGYSQVLMSAGYELFSYNNAVENNTLIITDNLTWHLGKHTVTGGLSYENQYISNSYMRQGSGYYRFKDIDAFKAYANGDGVGRGFNPDYHPVNFAFTYPINGYTDPKAELTFGQFSAYLQDEWRLNDKFRLTYGLRIDLPMYLSGAIGNEAIDNKQTFRHNETVDLSSWPKTKVLWSPRVGFNWDVNDEKTIKLRGGAGIFTGRIPFVWFVNQPQNSGMLQYQLVINQTGGAASQAQLARIPFEPNAFDLLNNAALNDIFPQQNVVSRIAAIDRDFKLPQVLRTSVAADFKLPLDMVLTLEGMVTKDINAIRFDNINMAYAHSSVIEGDVSRPYWSNSTNDTKYINSDFTDVVIMKNTGKGYSYALSAQLALPYFYGFSGSLAYTYTYGKEVTGKNGSDPFSAWQYRHIVQSLNSEEMGFTMNYTPHRVIASASYQFDYAEHFRSTFSFFYNGYKGGAYSFIYSNDANRDGTTGDLMFIPKKMDDVIWVNGYDDASAYFRYADNSPYLKKNAGKYAERYGAHQPFYHRLDFRFLQDFYVDVAGKKNTIQLSLDILNVLNLLKSSWGINKIYTGSNLQVTPLRFEGVDAATGKARVSMNKYTDAYGISQYYTSPHQNPNSVSALWGIQLGVRYIFN